MVGLFNVFSAICSLRSTGKNKSDTPIHVKSHIALSTSRYTEIMSNSENKPVLLVLLLRQNMYEKIITSAAVSIIPKANKAYK